MELLDGEFGPLKVLMRHPGLDPNELANYITANTPAESANAITDGVEIECAMWRGVSDYRHPEHRMTSWASTARQAAMFCDMSPWAMPEFKTVKYRERAVVIAMVLHEMDGENWIEYVVLDDEKEQ